MFEVEDGKGNKVFKKDTANIGARHRQADFTLADEVNMGDYRIRAHARRTHRQKTVAVKRYVLPKFKTEVKTDKAFYLPQGNDQGEFQADYFFGKPVVGGDGRNQGQYLRRGLQGVPHLQGQDRRKRTRHLRDQAARLLRGHAAGQGQRHRPPGSQDHRLPPTTNETISRTYPVSDQTIRVTLIPEGGRVVPGIANRIFAAALYPDGSPAECSIDVWTGNQGKGKPLATLQDRADRPGRIDPDAEGRAFPPRRLAAAQRRDAGRRAAALWARSTSAT